MYPGCAVSVDKAVAIIQADTVESLDRLNRLDAIVALIAAKAAG